MPCAPAAPPHAPVPLIRPARPATRRRAAALAATGRAAVGKVLPNYMPISKGTVSLVNPNVFLVSADPMVLQRVADLMQEGGMLARPLNVAPLVVR